jgi:hypothetical protein
MASITTQGGTGQESVTYLVGERHVVGLQVGDARGLGVGQNNCAERFSRGGEGAVVDAGDPRAEGCEQGTMVRCAVSKGSWRCKHMFPAEQAFFRGKWQWLKNCPHHRAKQREKNKQPNSRTCQKRARESAAGKASAARSLERQQTNETVKQQRRDWKKTPIGKACISRSGKTPAGKARAKRNGVNQIAKRAADPGRKMQHKIACRVREMLRIGGVDSMTVADRTDLGSRDEIRAHIESTFTDGMHWSNHGLRGEDIWNLGHRIAASMYDPNNDADLRRCWSKANIFAQWSLENQDLSVALPPDSELLQLRAIWPLAWNNELPGKQQREQIERKARNAFGQG